MKLLFITQKLHGQDAFAVQWVNAFRARGYDVTVLCLEWRPAEIRQVLGPDVDLSFAVHSLGKEKGVGKVGQILSFWKLITTLTYDRVFIHMTPVWMVLGWLVWRMKNIPVYLWYTHYKMQAGVWLFMHSKIGKRAFCATPQSLPQYPDYPDPQSPKRVVLGHGIDLSFWPKRLNKANDPTQLLMVHRLSRSKRVEISLHALKLLPKYTLDIYGMEAEVNYVAEIKDLVSTLNLSDRVTFKGSAAAKDLPDIYTRYHLILNMASETIDKTMLEAMTCGCYPVTTDANAEAIGIHDALKKDTPEALAEFIRTYAQKAPIDADAMYKVVVKWHSLAALIEKMDRYIGPGE